ncbi:citrate synthase [Hydrogenoanaerobacterium saccharovorans]|uniref:Citrate synthase n=1 Tax=Hydrogenoanaerobacterium saccharovorans TaxID=474960 RepID=A0A1H8B1Z9_9FIRM|nr:citrate/2-methylcitrate synthase [Hydrogenoanaerobacterium saccharovorans]RPF47628.1 citrate synthase [Hydrogenoanaerobacterium saccharovorans]SEM76945.1 citrate synthase [Hydrogenoanaerobacterium saccharovorans]
MTFSSVKYGVAPEEERADIKILCDEYRKYNHIDPSAFDRYGVKRGLRNADGTGVMAGITNICNVHGYVMDEGEKAPIDGELIYRGINVEKLIEGCEKEDRYGYEEAVWLLLFGNLPTKTQLADFTSLLAHMRELPDTFTEDMILKAPSPNIMNKLARSVLALYSYDEDADDCSLENVLRQSVELIARMPTIMVSAYQVKRRFYDHKSMYFHPPKAHHSIAQTILYTMRSDKTFTEEEAKLLDKCMILHAEHGGGNNSTFATRVLTSSGTDTYSAIAAGIGSLKGPLHGGANAKVMHMMDCIKENVKDWKNDDEVAEYLAKLIRKECGDLSGKIYGMGHAVYTKSDPRARILKENALKLAQNTEFIDEFMLLDSVERLAPQVLSAVKGEKKIICANVDLYSGMVYKMLRIPPELYTPLFASSRIGGWCAHRVEELITGGRIIRPAYKAVSKDCEYIPLNER